MKLFVNNKKVSVGICILLFIISISGLLKFQLNVDYRVFFNERTSEVKIFNEFESVYGKSDFYILALETSKDSIYEINFLKLLEEVSHWAAKIPHSTRVDSLTHYLSKKQIQRDSFEQSGVLKKKWNLSDKNIQRIKDQIYQDASVVNRLVSKNKKMAAIWINIYVPEDNPNAVMESSSFIDKKIQDLKRSHPEIGFYISGISKMNSTFLDHIQKDLKTIIPLSLIFIFIVLFFLLGNIWMASGILVTNAMAASSAIGIGSYLGIAMTTPTSMAPTIILTLTVADCLHLALGALKQLPANQSWQKVVNQSVFTHFRPILLTSLTTMVGFLCLNLSESPTYHDLGNLTAIGVFFAFVYSILFYSVWLSIKEPKKRKIILHQGSWKGFTAFITRNTRAILITTSVLLISSCFFISKLELNDIFISWFAKETQFRQDTEKISSNLTGIYTFEYHIKVKDNPKGIFSSEYLSEIQEFEDWWKNKSEIWQVYSILDIIQASFSHLKHNQNNNSENINAYQNLQHQLHTLEDVELTHRISKKQNSTRLTVILKDITGKQMRKMAKEANQWIKNNMTKASTETTGATLLFANISLRNINSMLFGFSIGIVLITLILWLAFRNTWLVIVSVITNIFPIFIALGLWYFLYGIVDLAVSTVAAVSFGIIVDDTIHFLYSFRKNKEKGYNTEQSVQATLEEIGPTLIASTLTLNIGFATLIFSQFLLNDTLGLLSVITISVALLFDLIVLPAILIFLKMEKEC